MNAVIYARFSSHSQTEQSIDGQLHDCYAYAEREGLTVVHEYIDRAITGRYDDRPDFQQMIFDAKKHQFQAVIVWKLDRFARNRYDSAIYKHRLRQNGVKVLSAMENIGEGDESIILEAVLEASAEYYSRDLSKKVKRGRHENALKGLCSGGNPPLGYKFVDRLPVIDKAKAPIIQYAFKHYAAGDSRKEIVDSLNAKGYTNRSGKPLTYNSLYTALRNRKYIGEYIYNDIVLNNFPPLVDKETFEKVQIKLAAVAHAPAARKAKVDYLLQGKAFCGYCGGSMVGESGHGKMGATYNYYSCANRKKAHTCKKKNERKDFIEWYVVEQTINYVLTPERIRYIAQAVVQAYDNEFNSGHIRELERRIAAADSEMDRAVEKIMQTDVKAVRDRLSAKVEKLDQQKKDLEIDLSKLKIANGIRYSESDIETWLRQFCKGDIMDLEFQRRIIDVFINSIYLYDDKVVIFYNIKGGKQISYMEMIDSTSGGEPGADEMMSKVRISSVMAHQNGFPQTKILSRFAGLLLYMEVRL